MNKSLQNAIEKAKRDPNGLSDADIEFIYQQGRADAISDMLKVIDCDNTDCEDCEFFDYENDLGQLVTYCIFKREVQINEQKND